MDIKIAVGQRIKELRKIRDITQEQLAYISELDRTYINSVENGRRNISIVNLEKITIGLKVKLDDFFDDKLF
ncbi:putative transcriptional regulator [Desulfosporosinus acidiphilus SJ4]|uniref:Putative transcriptional regulator n=1 Tax=Desulfosporosinus acidiphilus (strain DSM 22704 / JCM 16185 / SJ4) TaxID=646529 RepID=I4DAD3_DESAJ|nr:helix-turn-helix transcriptional regulator [Desulfosporosinus acidiphilus]AFM42757.1 putative transcriptional regulator [Desulfosporosinus acidiphilus SJ4]